MLVVFKRAARRGMQRRPNAEPPLLTPYPASGNGLSKYRDMPELKVNPKQSQRDNYTRPSSCL